MNDDILTTLETMIVQGEKSREEMINTLETMLVQQGKSSNDLLMALEALIVQGNEQAKLMKEMMEEDEEEDEDEEEPKEMITFKLDPSTIKGEKGDDGHTPTEEELKKIIIPLIPEPVKGDDGYTPIKGKDYFDGEPGKPGKDGRTPIKTIDYWTEKDIQEMVDTSKTAMQSIMESSHKTFNERLKELGEVAMKRGEHIAVEQVDGIEDMLTRRIMTRPQGGGPGYLYEISDVDVSSGLTNGQTILWNSTLNRWVNGDVVSPASDKVKISAADTTSGYLNDELVVTSKLTKTILNPGANETLQLTVNEANLDHGSLAGLGDDDHTQYHTDARALTWLGTRSTSDLAEGSNLYFTNARARSALSATTPLTYNSGTGAFGITQSSGSTDGYLSSTDWTTFNNKVSTSRTISTTEGVQGGGDLSANRTLKLDINGLSTATVDAAADYFVFFDATDNTHKKVLGSGLPGGGGGTPGGSNNSVQYNNAGAFGGNSYLTYDHAGGTDLRHLTISEGSLKIIGSGVGTASHVRFGYGSGNDGYLVASSNTIRLTSWNGTPKIELAPLTNIIFYNASGGHYFSGDRLDITNTNGGGTAFYANGTSASLGQPIGRYYDTTTAVEIAVTSKDNNSTEGGVFGTLSRDPVMFITDATTRMHLTEGGRLGLKGITSPTAWLHLSANGSGTNEAPLKFQGGGSLLSTEEGGSVEYVNYWYYTLGTTNKRTGMYTVLHVNNTDVGNVGTGEDDLMTYTLPGKTMTTDKDFIEIEGTLTFNTNANSKRVKAYFGATQIFDSTAQLQNGGSMSVYIRVTRTGAATQDVTVRMVSNSALYTYTSNYTTAAETLTSNVIIKFTGEATSNDDIVQKEMVIKFGAGVTG